MICFVLKKKVEVCQISLIVSKSVWRGSWNEQKEKEVAYTDDILQLHLFLNKKTTNRTLVLRTITC